MAARGINKVILIGLLGQEPDIRYIPNGGAVTTLSLATGETWRDKQTGELRENTEWHRVVIYGKLAELAGEYLHKGAQVYIEGQLKTRKWQDNHGIDRYVTEVVVNVGGVMQMLGGRREGSHSQTDHQDSGLAPSAQHEAPETKSAKGKKPKKAAPPQSEPPQGEYPEGDFNDHIPF